MQATATHRISCKTWFRLFDQEGLNRYPNAASWRDGRVVEGAPLLREYRLKRLIEGSNPSLSANDIYK